MPDFFSYNPHTGVTHYTEFDEAEQRMHVIATQDVTALVEQNRRMAIEGVTDKGIKKELWLWARIPAVVQMELRKRGIDMFNQDPAMQKRFKRVIHSEYPYLKTTDKVNL